MKVGKLFDDQEQEGEVFLIFVKGSRQGEQLIK